MDYIHGFAVITYRNKLRIILHSPQLISNHRYIIIIVAVLDGADFRLKYKGKLPEYKFDFRNLQRVLWSNDGLIFVTYDHYKTFCEII